jgi:hypothetical protein
MSSNEISWIDLVKEHKWKIVVVIICLFAGFSYLSMLNQPVPEASSTASSPSSQPLASASATATPTGEASKPASSAAPSAVPTITVGTGPQAPTPTDWKPVANAFANAWANPKVGKDAWLSAIKPTVTPDLYDQFTNTDIERVGQLEVVKVSSEQQDYAGVNARVYFKNTNFTIMIHLQPQMDMTWLVSVVTSS